MTGEDYKAHPLFEKIEDAEGIIDLTLESSHKLQEAIKAEAAAKQVAETAANALAAAINDVRLELIITGKDKKGPLAGLAVSSKAYSVALEAAIDKEKSKNLLAAQVDDERRARWTHEDAKTKVEVARMEFVGLRYAADLKAAILKAASA